MMSVCVVGPLLFLPWKVELVRVEVKNRTFLITKKKKKTTYKEDLIREQKKIGLAVQCLCYFIIFTSEN